MTISITQNGVDLSLRRMLPHMLHVTENRDTLKSLESVWDVLNLLGQLSGTTTEMGGTKAAFASLTESLLHNLALTTYKKRVQEIAAQAQVAIDILVRNLYERTADIGFLALDDALRDFAAAALAGEAPDRGAMEARLQAYVHLYSVYRDVILVAPSGQVLARLPGGAQVEAMRDPMLAEVLASHAPYTEATVRSDLFPGESRNLLYGTRVLAQDGAVLGALFLCFDFETETGRIFDSLGRAGDWSVITLLDNDGRVIASSDPWQIAPGALLAAPAGDGHLMRFAGASYLTSSHASQGFQGYSGPPGWRALVLVPLAMAFEQGDDADHAAASTDTALLRAILASGSTFAPALQTIPTQADAIQRELNRSVWNANIRQGGASQVASNPAFSKVLLGEIVRTGTRMKDVFTRSINELQTMTVRAQLDDCAFLAALAMNILDRNLYERANDCRWWALDPVLRGLLESLDGSAREARLGARLAAINDLYSVYDSLLLFDGAGVVVAVSKAALAQRVGSRLDAAWCAAALVAPPDGYVVSEFVADAVYGDRPTYIYSAPLRSDAGQVIGGIAAVFDSAPQLDAVLCAGLPQSDGAFALFIDGADNVVASSDPRRPAGARAGVPAAVRAAALGGGTAQLIALDGQVLALGGAGSCGYREYGGTEGRAGQRLLALVCVPLSVDDGGQYALAAAAPASLSAATAAPAGESIEIASFYVGHYLLGVPASCVVEAIPFGGLVRLPNASDKLCGAIVYQGSTMLLYDLHKALGVAARSKRENMLTVVLRGEGGRLFGVLVERLGDIPLVALADIAPIGDVFGASTSMLASVVMTPGGDSGPMLTLLALDRIAALLNQQLR
ncbi:chemotaxis protein CheW [Massilia sp. S19_KUP03_FR1]|uniref:chemotaxis protein CheW n=1 Tax=Massilia sp. S19_KUP03_FR1 TaxID=3025503 RepID=UPI002FCDC059